MYSPEMAEALLEGRFVLLTGRVYAGYHPDPGGNVIPYDYDDTRAVEVVWDGGFRRPYYGAAQEVAGGARVVFDELPLSDASISEQALALLGKPWIGAVTRIIHDPANRNVQSGTGGSDVRALREILADRGVTPQFVSSTRREDHDILVRVERLRSMVYDANGRRGLLVSEDVARRRYPNGRDNMPVVGIHRALMEQTYKDGTDQPDRGPRVDHLSHPVDAVGYGAVYWNPVRMVDSSPWERAVADKSPGPSRLAAWEG